MIKRILLFLCLTSFLGTTLSGEKNNFTVVGYHTYWMSNTWQKQDLSLYDSIIFFTLDVEQDGNFEEANGWPLQWGNLVLRAKNMNKNIIPTFTLLSSEKFAILFSNTAYQQNLRRNILDAVRYANADGVHIDFEVFDPVSPAVRANFTRFIRDLRYDLNRIGTGKKLMVFTLALDPGEVYDEAAIANHADFLIVQGYDLHWKGSKNAGPISPLNGWGVRNWNNILSLYDKNRVPRKKLLMAVPYYGYEWPVVSSARGASTRGTGSTISYSSIPAGSVPSIKSSAKARIAQFGSRRDSESGSPYYVYQNSSGWYQGWYEDAVSLRAKYDFVKSKGLGGVAVFAMSYDNGELSATLKNAFGR